MRLMDLQSEYLLYLERQQGCSPSTVRTYRSAFGRCLRASAAIGNIDPATDTINRQWANRLVQELGRTLRPRTVHRNVTALRSMLGYALEEGYLAENPLVGVRLPKKDAVQRTPVTTEDLNALVGATRRLLNPVRGSMARALVLTAATGATRYSDLLPLRVTDLDLSAGTLLVRRGKGNKSRMIPLPSQTVQVLRDWLAVRQEWLATWPREPDRDGRPAVTALWLADRGRALGEDGLRRILRELCLIAGIDRRITLHDIRHAAATRMAHQGMPLVGIQAVLGHSNLTTTQGYIAGPGAHLKNWAERMRLPDRQEPAATNRKPAGCLRRTGRRQRMP